MTTNSAFDRFDLTGKSALITGGSMGIGFEITRALAEAGATVMIAARGESALESAAGRLAEVDGIDSDAVHWHRVDLAHRESVKDLTAHATSALDGVDIFVGNAGMEVQEPIDQISDGALDEQIRINLTANVELTRDLLPGMRRNGWGRFLYCSSAASQLGSANDHMSVYGAVKSALNGFARNVAAEAGRDGVTANTLVLGIYVTEMLDKHLDALGEEARRAFMLDVPSIIALGRPAGMHEVGGMVQLLASDAGSYITGACLAVDGGMTSMLRPNPVEEETLAAGGRA